MLPFAAAAILIGLSAPAKAAYDQDRLHAILNAPISTNQYHDNLSITGHHGFSLDVGLFYTDSTSRIRPRSTTRTSTVLRYTIPFGAFSSTSSAPVRTCDLSLMQHAKVATTAVVWSLTNRLIRGNGRAGEVLPGGATLWGHAVPWLFAATLHSNLTYGQAFAHFAADTFAEQAAGWSEALDMGLSSELPSDHPFYNPGGRTEDTIAMGAHLYRARSLSLAMLEQRYDVSNVALAAPPVGAAGYQLGRVLIEENVVPGWDQKGLWADLVGSRPYHVGELVHGATWGAGVARTLECAG